MPDNVYPKGYQPRSDSDVRQKLGNSQCFICDKPCTNEFNMSAHLTGAKHATQVVKLCKLLRVPETRINWHNCVLEPTKAQLLVRGNVVLYVSDALAHEVEQGIVSGLTTHDKSSLHTHVALSTHKEVILMGGREGSASSGWCQHCQPGRGEIDYPANFTH